MEYLSAHPWIDFHLDLTKAPVRFWMLLGEACAKCELIAGIPLMPETAKRLHRVSLERGARATTAIEGNTLSEDEISRLARGALELPPSKEYLGIEVQNILDVCNDMLDALKDGREKRLDVESLKTSNGRVLNSLPLDDDTIPGEIRSHQVGVARYRGAPAQDCEYLLMRLCDWLNEMDFDLGHRLALPIIKAVAAHLYLAWIHPFGDGNGRTARLVEWQILLGSGVPSPAAHLLSNHYNDTRSEYYRHLDRSSRVETGLVDFLVYALRGFVDGLTEQIETIKGQLLDDVWTNYIHTQFAERHSVADTRRRHLAFDLSALDAPTPPRHVRTLTPRLAEAYLNKTGKTITRDLNVLRNMGLITRMKEGVVANKDMARSFLPPERH